MAYQYSPPASQQKAIPEYAARKDDGPMSKDDFAAVVQHALTESVSFVDAELSVERAKATEYYLGKPLGNEEEGRSQVVLTEVRDAVDGMIPSLLRVFFGSEHTVEFVPNRADGVEQAAQKTDYVRYVFEEDNGGFLKTLAVLKDGMVRKIGIFKWGWDDSRATKAYRMDGLTRAELESLAANDDVTLTEGGTTERTEPDPATGKPMTVYDVELTHREKGGRAVVWAIPPEEFVFNRQARSADEALLLFHRTDKTRGELLAMGIDEKLIDEHGGPGNTSDVTLKGNAEEIARRDIAGVGRVAGSGFTNDPEMGSANAKILYCEGLMAIDFDGDGIAETRRVCTIGPTYYPVENDPADEGMGFALFTPYPEPHTLLGGSVADRTMDVQRINSALMRGMLDSLSAAIFPRTVYLEGQASVADIMNTAIGAPIRERVANAVRTLDVDFTGKEVLPVLGFMQDVIERRTGRNKGAAGLDADALQSTGKEAVGAVLTGSQEQLEMIARIFAEGTLKPLFRGLGRLLQLKQPRARVVRLRGQWVDVDPRSWDDAMDVTVNVGLGTTFTDKKVATLMAVAADQHEILTSLGPANPMVSLAMWRNTRAKILALQGIKDVDSYYKPVDPNWQPPAPPGPPPDPNAQALQAEKEMNQLKTVKELAIKQDELALKKADADRDFAFKVKQHADDVVLRKYQIDAEYHGSMTQAQLDAEATNQVQETELALQAHGQLHDHAMDRAQFRHDREMDQRAADTADMQAQQTAPSGSEGPEGAEGGE